MPLALVNAPNAEPSPSDLLVDYLEHLALTGRGNAGYIQAARGFLRRWPIPQHWADEPLGVRLQAGSQTRPFLTFLMVHGWLRPGWDWLVERKLSSFWRDLVGSPLEADMTRFVEGAEEIGFTHTQAIRAASQSIGRILIQTGRPLDQVTVADLDTLAGACRLRADDTGAGWRHYRSAIACCQRVLFHLQILDAPPAEGPVSQRLVDRLAVAPPELRARLVAYLEAKTGTCRPKTVSCLATRLAHFGRFLTEIDPQLASLADLDRCRHIEPYLAAVAAATNTITGEPVSTADQARRVLAVAGFLADISEWGWPDAPTRRLLFRTDIPRLPRALPRYLPVDTDRRLTDALAASDYRLAADALLLARACGLRIGELLDLELDCVHEIPGHGAWLKVPLGKLDTERMVPLDDETTTLIDRISVTRSTGRPLPHPRTSRPAQFLFTHHGRRLSQTALRLELNRAGATAGIGHVTPHQLRHTYATTLVNAGCSLQALMALLGHTSAEMSLRYARLFDSTVRGEYERALDRAKNRIGPLPDPQRQDPTRAGDWRQTPTIKTRLAAGYCLRAPAQGACHYANICEHCPSYRVEPTNVEALTAQRADAHTLALDAETRGWTDDADRHRRLIARLDTLIADQDTDTA